ncbi:MAG TPA: DUF2269 family protein [Bacillota bacterium]|nr:DUF2269 family protein [Bacillota bacterium]
MSLYSVLIVIHVLSAILGLGPGFVMIYIVTKSKTMTELRHAFFIRNRVHHFVMIGGILLLVTGLWMGFLKTYLFKAGWYIVSLILYLIALAAGPLWLKPLSEPIKNILENHQGDDIPEEYEQYAKRLFFYERILNTIFIIIIVLMITKPF